MTKQIANARAHILVICANTFLSVSHCYTHTDTMIKRVFWGPACHVEDEKSLHSNDVISLPSRDLISNYILTEK